MVSTNFLAQKTIGKKKKYSKFWFQEIPSKGVIFVNFLPQKFMTKYGFVSTCSVTFVSMKILACLQCLDSTLATHPLELEPELGFLALEHSLAICLNCLQT